MVNLFSMVKRFLFQGILPCLFILWSTSCSNSENGKLFREVSPRFSGLTFTNALTENNANNMLMFSNFYTGGGVGVLDINNDGLQDLILGGNQVSSRLFLNKGGLKFQDITEKAGLETDRWITGISIVDINTDGFDDIYLSVSGFVSSGRMIRRAKQSFVLATTRPFASFPTSLLGDCPRLGRGGIACR